jgi:hypothetical protein
MAIESQRISRSALLKRNLTVRSAAFNSLLLAALALSSAHGQSAPSSEEPWLGVNSSAYLGSAFDQTQEVLKAQSCVEGRSPILDKGFQSEVYFDKPLGKTALGSVLQTKGRILPAALVKENFWQNLGSVEQLTGTSDVFHFLYLVQGLEESFESPRLKANFAQMKASDFLISCGTRFVSKVERGGFLLISLVIQYDNSRSAAFIREDANWQEASLYTFVQHMQRISPALRSHLSIHTNILQVGGQPQKLLEVLAQHNSAPSFSCDPTQAASCQQKLDAVAAYASRDKVGFRAQFEEVSDSLLIFTTKTYQEAGLGPAQTEQVQYRASRDAIIQAKLQSDRDRFRLQKILGMRLHRQDQKNLQVIKTAIERNDFLLKRAVKSCFDEAKSCAEWAARVSVEWSTYRVEDIVHKPDFLDYCTSPLLELPLRTTVDALLGKAGTQDCYVAFQALNQMESLDLSSLGISDISPLANLDSPHPFALDLSRNQIVSIEALSSITRLFLLNLRNNRIKDISPLKDRPDLQVLDLGYNAVDTWPEGLASRSLKALNVIGNPLVDSGSLRKMYPEAQVYVSAQDLCSREIDWVQSQGLISRPEADEYRALEMAPYYSTFPARSRFIQGWINCKVAARSLPVDEGNS